MLEGQAHAAATAVWRSAARAAPRALPVIDDDIGGKPFAWTHAVRSFEIDPGGALRPPAVLHWFEHAVYRAAELVGWDPRRMRDADFVTLQIGHHLILNAAAETGACVAIVSRLVEMRRVSGTWHHEARLSDGVVLAADRSRGAFLDLAGRVRRPPEDMIASLLAGEPGAG